MYAWSIACDDIQEIIKEGLGIEFNVKFDFQGVCHFRAEGYPGELIFDETPDDCGGLLFKGDEKYHRAAVYIARFFNYSFIVFNNVIERINYGERK